MVAGAHPVVAEVHRYDDFVKVFDALVVFDANAP